MNKQDGATTGFCAPEDEGMAVCLLPVTEVSFADQVRRSATWPWTRTAISYKTAIFRQIDKDKPNTHHDALEFPNGEIVLLTNLAEGQQASVLQLPAPRGTVQAKEEAAVASSADADLADAIS